MKELYLYLVLSIVAIPLAVLGYAYVRKPRVAGLVPNGSAPSSMYVIVLIIVTAITVLCGAAGFYFYIQKEPNKDAADVFLTMFKLGFGGLVGLLGGGAMQKP